jgi:predicted lipoprotein with Yx(FWY)xxD motif
LVAGCAAAIVGAGCGGEDVAVSAGGASDASERADAPRAGANRRGKKVQAIDSRFGRVLADGRGEAFYSFGRDPRGRSRCYGECARVWPPVLTTGRPRAGSGSEAGLLGTSRRRDGKLQVTYDGRPLYYYVGDSPGRILCQDVSEFGGVWLVVAPDGVPVS